MQPAVRPAALSPRRYHHNLRLWQIAKRRAKFQSHLVVFALINTGLWALWALLPKSHGGRQELPWPIYTTLFWGFGVLAQGLSAYSGLNRGGRTQHEYERLLSEQRY